MQAEVVDARIMSDSSGSKHAEYIIVISMLKESYARMCEVCGTMPLVEGDVPLFEVYHRYSDFQRLHEKLTSQYRHATFPVLPPGTWFRSIDQRFVSTRKAGLRLYVARGDRGM